MILMIINSNITAMYTIKNVVVVPVVVVPVVVAVVGEGGGG